MVFEDEGMSRNLSLLPSFDQLLRSSKLFSFQGMQKLMLICIDRLIKCQLHFKKKNSSVKN